MATSRMVCSRSKLRLSRSEQAILDLLPLSGRRLTTEDITAKHYGRAAPYHGRIVVAGVVRSLERKTSKMNLGGRVRRSKRAGPHPIEVWWERK